MEVTRLALRPFFLPLCLGLAEALAPSASAQGYDQQWARFVKDPARLNAGEISSGTIEVDFAVGDLDQDGWVDVIVGRKEPFTKAGKRTNLLLMNLEGVLTDETAAYASDADFAGDQGFRTPTNTRDELAVDLTGDGWLDVVTATALGDTDPQHVNHPRVYRNKGEAGGAWQGLRFENARIPPLMTFTTGTLGVPRFAAVLAGDVDEDGDVDLYFVDHDDGVGGYHQPPNTDLEDRLLFNDGTGHFSDVTLAHMSLAMVQSTFGTSGAIVDINQDGALDILKNDTNSPNVCSAAYAMPANPGTFNIYDEFYATFAPYHMDVGDLNNDGRLDMVAGDDSSDRFLFNQGNDPLGRVIWGPANKFTFLTGSDADFTGAIHIVDLDADGWNDVWIADQDVDVASGSSHRTHLYHNLGGTPGSFSIVLREERESSSSGPGEWIGAVGFETSDLQLGFDAGFLDIDRDGDLDVINGRVAGTMVWMNQLDPVICQPVYGHDGPGASQLSVCGQALSTGHTGMLELSNAPPGMPAWVVGGIAANPVPIFGGTIVPIPYNFLITGVTNGQGKFTLGPFNGGGGPKTVYVQALVVDLAQPDLLGITPALEVLFLP